MFAAAEYVGDTTTVDTLVQFGASGRYWVWRGEPWRMPTSVFLHIGIVHFLWNTWGLLGWCREVETSLGSWRFAAIVLGLFMNMDNVAHGTGLVLGVIAGAWFTSKQRALRAIPVALTVLLAVLASFPLPVIDAP